MKEQAHAGTIVPEPPFKRFKPGRTNAATLQRMLGSLKGK